MKNLFLKQKLTLILLVCLFGFIKLAFADNNKTQQTTGKQVFEKYCWGCHHQKSTAFGPSFSQIANTRTKSQAIFHITNPALSYEKLGYKRTAMPSFNTVIKPEELNLIVEYIFSFKNEE